MRMANIGGKLPWIMRDRPEAFRTNVWLLLSQTKWHWTSLWNRGQKQHYSICFAHVNRGLSLHGHSSSTRETPNTTSFPSLLLIHVSWRGRRKRDPGNEASPDDIETKTFHSDDVAPQRSVSDWLILAPENFKPSKNPTKTLDRSLWSYCISTK